MNSSHPTEPRRDAFTGKVLAGKGPRTVIKRLHWRTGREYFTRVPIQECGHVYVRQIVQRLGWEAGDHLHHAGQWAVEWRPDQRTFSVRPLADAAAFVGVAVPLLVSLTGQAQGFRLWLACPHCGRRCAALYASPWTEGGEESRRAVTGCRTCLGLTDLNKQRHKCQDWAGRVLNPDGAYGPRGPQTIQRARNVRVNGLRTLTGRIRAGIKPGHPEVEAQLDSLIVRLDEWETP